LDVSGVRRVDLPLVLPVPLDVVADPLAETATQRADPGHALILDIPYDRPLGKVRYPALEVARALSKLATLASEGSGAG
jgi:hypothetical protein